MDKKTTEEALQKTGKGLKGVVGEFKEFISREMCWIWQSA